MYNHGVKVNEQSTSVITPINGTAGLQVVFGTAPVNLLEDPYNATNKLQICYTFEEAVKKVGYSDDFTKYTLCQAIDASFRVFNVAPIILVNVLDPNKHKKSNLEEQYVVAAGECIVNIEGILLDTVVVKSEDGNSTFVKDVDYIVAFNDDGYVVVSIIGTGTISTEKKLTISSCSIDTTVISAKDIIGGVDVSTQKETGLELVRQIYPTFGLTPGLLLAPGWSHDPDVATVLAAKCTEINGAFNCECILDLDTTKATTYEKVKEVKESSGFTSEHAIVVWPKVKVGSKTYYYSAIAGALIAYTDANNNDVPNLSPSNRMNKVTASVLEDGTEVYLDQVQANQVNSYGVCTAINMNGWRMWGNNTAIYPASTEPKDRWICVRRFFSWWGNSFILTYTQKVDNPGNYRLIQSVVDSENIRGNSYKAQGYCAGARIEFLQEENPITDILNGKIQFHQKLAPYTPAEYILNTLEFDPTMIQAEMSGGDE